jgi:hypothetical protein
MDNSTENLKLVNKKEKSITNSMLSSLQGSYNQLKQKVNDLEKNNESIKKLYKSEQERLTKINNIIFSKTDEGRIPYIKQLEKTILNLRKDNEKLQSLINEKKLLFGFLKSHENQENTKYNCINDNEENENNLEKKNSADENSKALIEEMKTDFENKLSLKLRELKDYYDEKNGTKYIEPVPIPQKPQSLFQSSEKKPEQIKNFEIHSIHYNTGLSDTDIQLINNLIAVQCLKEEYPKEFFIDYVFNEVEFANLNDDYSQKESQQLKRIEQNKLFHNSLAVNDLFVAKNIAKIFEINSTEDINMLCKYLNTISKKNHTDLKIALNENLTGFRYRQYEQDEKNKYEEELRKIFEGKINDIKLKGNGDIINIAEMNYFLKMNNITIQSDLYYYLLQLMKLSKKERLFNGENITPLHLYELYLPALINILKQAS